MCEHCTINLVEVGIQEQYAVSDGERYSLWGNRHLEKAYAGQFRP